jgi:uncharacterized phage protein (TIGR01671 family)
MREIKFRAWDKDEKRMRYGGFFVQASSGYAVDEGREQFENYHLMQFTGLKDKNGKEIYEGDIVRITHEDEVHEHDENCESPCDWPDASKTTVVKWDDEFGGIVWSEPELFEGEYMYSFAAEPYVYEIIGNIYENAELLTT